MREYIYQILVQFPDNRYCYQEFLKIKTETMSVVNTLAYNVYFDSRTYTFASVSFICFTFVSLEEFTPTVLCKFAKQLEGCTFMMSPASGNFDLSSNDEPKSITWYPSSQED